MKERYERDLYHSWMIIEIDQIYEEDYQMRMLIDNEIPVLLEVIGQGEDDKSIYRYRITGKKSIKESWLETSWSYEKLEDFMRQLIQVLYTLENYLLDVNALSLNINHIYMDGDRYVFCYLPGKSKSIWKEFHVLMEHILKEIDYEDKEAIYLAYELHKASMEEHYDMEQALEQILEKKEKEMNSLIPKKKEIVYDIAEEQILDDWAGIQEMTGKVVRDHQTVWGFVSKKIRKRNRDEWSSLESNPAE